MSDSLNRGGERRSSVAVSTRSVPVLPADTLRTLSPWHVLVLYRSTRPTIARIRPVWARRSRWGARWTGLCLRVTRRPVYWTRRWQLVLDRRLGR